MAYDSVLNALGDPTRRAILDHLRGGPRPVGVLARRLPVSRPAVSQHLRVLREAGLVSVRQVGTRRLYAISPAGPEQLREYADHLWNVALERFKEAAERGTSQPDKPPARRRPGFAGRRGRNMR